MVAISSPRKKDSDGASHSLRLLMLTEATTIPLPLSLLRVSIVYYGMFCPNLTLIQDHEVVLLYEFNMGPETGQNLTTDFPLYASNFHIFERPHPPSAGTTKSQRRVGTRKRPPPKKQN